MEYLNNGLTVLSEAIKSDDIYTDDIMLDGCRSHLREELKTINTVDGEDDDIEMDDPEEDYEDYEYPEEAVFIREYDSKFLIEYYDFYRYMKQNKLLDSPRYAYDTLVEFYSNQVPGLTTNNTFILIESNNAFNQLIEESKVSRKSSIRVTNSANALAELKSVGIPLVKKKSRKK